MRRPTLRLRLALGLALAMATGFALHTLWIALLPFEAWPALATAVLVAAAFAVLAAAAWLLAPLARVLRTLEGAVLSYRDGDFSAAVAGSSDRELGEFSRLAQLHAELAEAIREQRLHLAQRELLLDTVVQNTPAAMVLTDKADRIAYANLAARQLLGGGRSLEGASWPDLLADGPAAMAQAVEAGQDALFSVEIDGSDETFHLLQRGFRLNGRPHRLHLFRRMTRELSRQEVAAWKRVLRVVSHELNNSLAPISSLAHSGQELVRRGEGERAIQVMDTIGQRVRRLHGFLDGYARFAKLPQPRREAVRWAGFIDGLRAQQPFHLQGTLPAGSGWFDATQVEQALINVLKNAHESGGTAEAIGLGVSTLREHWRFEVTDQGPGMSDAVLAQALLPFYSTKRSGTGLGLALAREIAEAHGGAIALRNRPGGGLQVTLTVARPPDDAPR